MPGLYTNLEFLETLRVLELEKALDFIKSEKPNSTMLLEIGAGSGWQAKKISERGYSVEAIDVKESNYSNYRIWQVQDYDGKHIPYPNAYFDIVFSSNVLEHIPHVNEFQKEIQRVLKPDGIAVHILPNSNWRFWTNITYYPFAVSFIVKKLLSKNFPEENVNNSNNAVNYADNLNNRSFGIKKIIGGVFPKRHGEIGTALSEFYYFSKSRWIKLFKDTGWKVKKYSTNNLFYTGYTILGFLIPMEARKRLSYIVGSSCHLFVLTKNNENNE